MEITLKLNETDSEMVEMHTKLFKLNYLMGVAHIDNFVGEIGKALETSVECRVKMTLIEEAD